MNYSMLSIKYKFPNIMENIREISDKTSALKKLKIQLGS
jgi:hypothetical protein